MSEKLFKENVLPDILRLVEKGRNYARFNLEIVEKILAHIIRENSSEGEDYTSSFNEDDFLLVKKDFRDIVIREIMVLHMVVSVYVDLSKNEDDFRDCNDGGILLTETILEFSPAIKDGVNKIIDKITKIKREKFRRDIVRAIYVLKDVETYLLKIINDIASLYMWDY